MKNGLNQAHPYCAAVVPAAGSASRMKGIDKILTPIDGVPVLVRTLQALSQCPLIDEIVITTREDLITPIEQKCVEYQLAKVKKVIRGGKDRAESVYFGLCACSEEVKLVAIHDGARPFISQQVLEDVLTAGAKTGAAAPAVPVKDTIKQAQGGVVTCTLDRSTLFAIQTPQVFWRGEIISALEYCRDNAIAITDDCSAAEAVGKVVTLTQGEDANIKITTPFDLKMGEAILQCQQN